MDEAEYQKFLDSTITLTWREYDLSLERARQSGLTVGMLVGRQNATFEAESQGLKASLKTCDSMMKIGDKTQ